MKFTTRQEFELHVHNCFNKIFEQLMKMDSVVKVEAEKEEANGNFGVMCDLRDSLEVVILHCHLAWQYHRLSKAAGGLDPWSRSEIKSQENE